MTIRIFIGANPEGRDKRAVAVLQHSILSNTEADVDFTVLGDGSGGTGFSETRWAVPSLCDYVGYAIYLDADMLVLDDIEELYQFSEGGHWVTSDTFPKGSSAVSVIDCSCYRDQPEGRTLKPSWEDKRLVEAGIMLPVIPGRWNRRNEYVTGDTSLIHYTSTKKQPWGPEFNLAGVRYVDRLWLDYERDMIDER